jgi:hypothetical protein
MNIRHIGHSTIRTPIRNLQLRKILHVPSTKKNLVYLHRFTSDNNNLLEFHPSFFLIKDRDTKSILVERPCRKGLYYLPSTTSKQVFGVNKVSLDRWHSRLGHPSFPIVEKVLRNYKLPFVSELNKDVVCDACQRAKSHQLPYPISTSTSTQPLELIFNQPPSSLIAPLARFLTLKLLLKNYIIPNLIMPPFVCLDVRVGPIYTHTISTS